MHYLYILISLGALSFAAELPKEIEKCRFGDSTCVIKSMNQLIQRYPKGIPEIGLPPLDSTRLQNVSVLNSTYRGPIWLNFHLRDNVYRGFNNATITHVEGFLEDPTQKQIQVKARMPRLVHEAVFDMEGRFLLFKANATGKLLSDFQNFRLTLTIKVIVEYRNNKRYLKIYELVPLVDLDRWIVLMDNLYKENTDLTIALNRAFNENWLEYWNNLEPGIISGISVGFTDMLNNVLKKISYDDMFLPPTKI